MNASRNRREGSRAGMFFRLLLRATLVRRGRALTALMAVVIASCAAAAMMNLYADVQAKLRKEFRSYGANIVVVAKDGQALPADALAKVDAVLGARGTAVPFGYTVARTANGTPIVLAGTEFSRARKMNSFWSVTDWPTTSGQALVGIRAAAVISAGTGGVDLAVNGKPLHLSQAGLVKTGGDEDSRVYVSLDDFSAATGLTPSSIEIGATGSPDEIRGVMEKIAEALPAADVRPIRQIMEGEARVLGKTRSTLLAAILVIIATAALCMLATLTAWVLERRKDFAVMKALGASNALVNGFFAAEAAAIGALGAVLGFGLGIGVAEWIGRANFHAAVVPRLEIFPAVFFGSVGVALLSAIVPISLLERVQPAAILRGE